MQVIKTFIWVLGSVAYWSIKIGLCHVCTGMSVWRPHLCTVQLLNYLVDNFWIHSSLSFVPDSTKVWPTERRRAPHLDWGHNRLQHWGWLPKGPEKWSHSVPVSLTLWSNLSSPIPAWTSVPTLPLCHNLTIVLLCSFTFRLINILQPGSVKKINNSSLNWHQVRQSSCPVRSNPDLTKQNHRQRTQHNVMYKILA